MKDTKEKIIVTSLQLFNEQGLSLVTLRTIAKEMGISQGNLNYHYKKREDIIETLYQRLVNQMDKEMSKIAISDNYIKTLQEMSYSIMNTTFEYRFFLIDFSQIMKQHSSIKAHYQELIKHRKQQTMGMFELMIQDGIIRTPDLPNEYENLYKRIQIFCDFWMSSAAIEKNKIEKTIIPEYIEMITQAIFPYLTEKGIQKYKLLNN